MNRAVQGIIYIKKTDQKQEKNRQKEKKCR